MKQHAFAWLLCSFVLLIGSDGAFAADFKGGGGKRVLQNTAVENGTVDGVPVSWLIEDEFDPENGEFAGTYVVQFAPGASTGPIPPWLQIKVWERKAERLTSEPGGQSVYELARRDLSAVASVRTSVGDFFVRTVRMRGSREFVATDSIFSGATTGDLGCEAADSISTFVPSGRGKIRFSTLHRCDDGQNMTTEGLIFLDGNLRGRLRREVRMLLTLDIREGDTDGSDGILSGRFSGRVDEIVID